MANLLSRKSIYTRLFSVSGLASCLAVLLTFTSKPEIKMRSSHTLLALGDSYTIGESVLPAENFPNQTVELLRKANFEFREPVIVAQTGWTTDELQDAIDQRKLKASYDFVTLLIGVNNQYRCRPIHEYKTQFEFLLKQAIHFANGKADHVIVLSIPDWGVTPYAKTAGRDLQQIRTEIDAFNDANNEIAKRYKVNYVNITPGTRDANHDLNLVASDGLHPSAKEYARWADQLSKLIESRLN